MAWQASCLNHIIGLGWQARQREGAPLLHVLPRGFPADKAGNACGGAVETVSVRYIMLGMTPKTSKGGLLRGFAEGREFQLRRPPRGRTATIAPLIAAPPGREPGQSACAVRGE